MAFEQKVRSGARQLRCGFTTGSCAALAAQSAVRLLLGQTPGPACIVTPSGSEIRVEPEPVDGPYGPGCGVRKFAGDDIDATDGALICAAARFAETQGVCIRGGEGVGRVTRPGLDQPVGEAAINSVPRQMIQRAAEEVLRRAGCSRGVEITVWVPGGREIAARTFNPRLGIEDGISILGTSGIVRPQSVQALVDSIELEIRQKAALGARTLLLTPGNYGERYIAQHPQLAGLAAVQCSNYIGEALDCCALEGVEQVVLVGHIGKLIKVAGGIFNTHSRVADCRAELLCAHAALCGGDRALCTRLMEAVTTDAGLALLQQAGLREAVLDSLLRAVDRHLALRAAGRFAAGAELFSNTFGTLGRTAAARAILEGKTS